MELLVLGLAQEVKPVGLCGGKRGVKQPCHVIFTATGNYSYSLTTKKQRTQKATTSLERKKVARYARAAERSSADRSGASREDKDPHTLVSRTQKPARAPQHSVCITCGHGLGVMRLLGSCKLTMSALESLVMRKDVVDVGVLGRDTKAHRHSRAIHVHGVVRSVCTTRCEARPSTHCQWRVLAQDGGELHSAPSHARRVVVHRDRAFPPRVVAQLARRIVPDPVPRIAMLGS